MHALPLFAIESSTSAPGAGPSAVCIPGQQGVPGSVLGSLVCGTWAQHAPALLWQLARTHTVLLACVLGFLIAARVGWSAARHRVWRRHAARGRWLEIVPPVSATPEATVGLWRLLATILPVSSWWSWRPHRIVWEVYADPKGMRCGLWLPPGVNPTAVLRLLQRGWPGARAEQTRPPGFAPGSRIAAVALRATQPEWLPLVDQPSPARSARPDAMALPEQDRLRAVYDGLAAAGRTGGGLLQVHVARAPGRRVAALRRATVRPDRARRPRGAGARIAALLADGLRALLLGVLTAFTPGPTRHMTSTGRIDPYLAELARQARGKYAAAPHLVVAVHAIATGPSRAAAKAAAADVTSGFGLLSAHFTRRRLRRARTAAASRWVPASRMVLASVEETSALAGLPAEPSAHGLPAAASRRRPVGRDVFTAGPVPTTSRPSPTADRGKAPTDAGEQSPPTVWSAP